MVGKRFAMPGRLACWGTACWIWCGLVMVGNSGFSDEPKVQQDKPAAEAAVTPVVTFPKSEATATAEDAAERKAVEEALKNFATTFNDHKADQVAALYTTNAELVDLAGRVTRGRAAIHEMLAKVFVDQPQIKIQMEVQSIRFLSPELAIEEGISTITSGSPNAPTVHRDHYTVTHIKHDGKWLMASARDSAPPPLTAQEQLQQLEWLVGEWVDENSDTVVHTTYYWSEDKRYLFSKYSVQRAGEPTKEGLQRIGWDPQLQQLRSWTFDAVGGFSEGLWSRSGDQWIVKRTGTTVDGKIRSATTILTKLGPDHALFQSRDRVTGGVVMPDQAAVPVVRKAPAPVLPKAVEKAASKSDSKPTE